MKYLNLLTRLFVALTVAVLLVAVVAYVASEIAVVWYMWDHNIPVRAELSEDMGFGMLGFLVTSVSALTVFFQGYSRAGGYPLDFHFCLRHPVTANAGPP